MNATDLSKNFIASSVPVLGCTTCNSNNGLTNHVDHKHGDVTTKDQKMTTFNPQGLNLSQNDSFLRRAQEQIQTSTQRSQDQLSGAVKQGLSKMSLEAKTKTPPTISTNGMQTSFSLNHDVLQQHQRDFASRLDVHRQQLNSNQYGFNQHLNEAFQKDQVVEKHRAALDSKLKLMSSVAASVPTSPSPSPSPSPLPLLGLKRGTNTAVATAVSSVPTATTAASTAANIKQSLNHFKQSMNMDNLRGELDNIHSNVASRADSFATSAKINLEKFAQLQKDGEERIKASNTATQDTVKQLESFMSIVSGLNERFGTLANQGARAGQTLSMVTDVIQSVQAVNMEREHFSMSLDRNAYRTVMDSITMEWFRETDDQQKLNAAHTFIAREDTWTSLNKKKNNSIEWKDIVLYPSGGTVCAFAVGTVFHSELQTKTLVVSKLTYHPQNAVFELDPSWNRNELKIDCLKSFAIGTQILLYPGGDDDDDTNGKKNNKEKDPVVLILCTTHSKAHQERKTACLIALNGTTGELVSNFFPSTNPNIVEGTAIWGLTVNSQLYAGSHGVRMSLNPTTHELLLLCHVQRVNLHTGSQLQSVVVKLDKKRHLISPPHSPLAPLVELTNLAPNFYRYTFVALDVCWTSATHFHVCGFVSCPQAQVEESRGFISMFDATGKYVSWESLDVADVATMDANSQKTDDGSARHKFETGLMILRSSSSSSLSSSSSTAPSSPMSIISLESVKSSEQQNTMLPPTTTTTHMTIGSVSLEKEKEKEKEKEHKDNDKDKYKQRVTIHDVMSKKSLQNIFADQKTNPGKRNQQNTLNTIRPMQFRPLVAREKEREKDKIVNCPNTNTVRCLTDGYGTHFLDFEHVPNLMIHRIQVFTVSKPTVLFLGTAMPHLHSVKRAFPFVGQVDSKNERLTNITIIGNHHNDADANATTGTVATEFCCIPSLSMCMIVGQSFRNPNNSDTSEISLNKLYFHNNNADGQEQEMTVQENYIFRLRGDYHQVLSSIKYSEKLKACIGVGSCQSTPMTDVRRGVVTVTRMENHRQD